MDDEKPSKTPGGTQTLTPQERELLALYRELPPLARENALELFRAAVQIPMGGSATASN